MSSAGSWGNYPGSDPGRLPGAYLGATGEDGGGCPHCGCQQCECESPAPSAAGNFFTIEGPSAPGSCSRGGAASGVSGSAASGLLRAGQMEQTARRMGVNLPWLSPSGACQGDAGPCALWMNPRGNLVRTIGPPLSGGLAPMLMLTHNSMGASMASDYGRGWSLNLGQRVSSTSDGDVVLIGPLGSQLAYAGTTTMSSGERYTPPAGARNSLIKLDAGWAETRPDGSTFVYDSGGKLSRLEGPAGRWTLTYDGGRVSEVLDPTGSLTTFSYDGSDRLSQIMDSAGRVTQFNVDGSEDLVEVTSPELCIHSFIYDANHQLTEWTLPSGISMAYEYDGQGRLTKLTSGGAQVTTVSHQAGSMALENARGLVATYLVNTDGTVQALVNPLNERTTYTWEAKWPKTITEARGNVYTFNYASLTNDPGLAVLESVTRPSGGCFTYLLDANDQLETLIDERSNYSTLTWDGARLRAFENALGQRTTYGYTSQYRQLETMMNPLGRTWTYTYDSQGRNTAFTNPLDLTSQYTYNDAGFAQTVANPLGEISTCLRDDVNRVMALVNPLGETTSYTYVEGASQVRTLQNALGYVTTNQYDEQGRLKATENALGQRTTLAYDEVGNLRSMEDARGCVTTNRYDNANQLWSTENPLGHRSTFGYDAAGNQTRIEDALGNIATTLFDGDGRPSVLEDAGGYRTTTQYDLAGNVWTVENARGEVATNAYDRLNRLEAVQDPLGHVATTGYDAAGNLRRQTNALGFVTSWTFDNANRRIAVENALGYRATTQYDGADRPMEVMNAVGSSTTMLYDLAGRLEELMDARGNRWTTVYDAVGQERASVNPLNSRTTQTYDPVGRRLSLEDPNGNVTEFAYDAIGNVIKETDPAGNIVTYMYDKAGQRESRQDARGVIVTYGYEPNGWLASRAYTNDQPATFQYDSRGNRLLMWDGTGRTTHTYDELSRVHTVRNFKSELLTYSYDQVGNRAAMAVPVDGVFTYHYDDVNQLDYLDNPFSQRTTFAYDALGRETRREYSNASVATTSYDGADRILLLQNYKSGGDPIRTFSYSYDQVGNRIEVLEDSGDAVRWTYDKANQLTNEQRTGANAYNTAYHYDPAGNRDVLNQDGSVTTSTYNSLNQLTKSENSSGVTTFGYDLAGNQTGYQEPDGDRMTYTWDDENRRTGRTQPGGQSETSSYNADGLRVQTVDSLFTTDFLWDGQRYLGVTTTLLTFPPNRQVYTQGLGVYGDLISRHSTDAWERHWLYFDGLGSTIAEATSDESIIGRQIYDAYGNIVSNSMANMLPFTYVGKYGYYANKFLFTNTLADYYVRARTYEPSIARWLSRDPLGLLSANRCFSGTTSPWSLYKYADSNPLTVIDPTGQVVVGAVEAGCCFGLALWLSSTGHTCWELPVCKNKPNDRARLECAKNCMIQAFQALGPWNKGILIAEASVCSVAVLRRLLKPLLAWCRARPDICGQWVEFLLRFPWNL